MNTPGSQQVSFWSVYRWVQDRIGGTEFPTAGTPAWCALDDDDPAKLAAVLDAGSHHSLRVEIAQEQRAAAARAIARAADWPAIARRYRRGRGRAYIPRRTA